MKTYVIQTRLDQDTIDKLKLIANEHERTMSSLIRFILKEYIKKVTDENIK